MTSVTFNNAVDPRTDLELLRRNLPLNEYEEQIKSFRNYIFKNESWILQETKFLSFISYILNDSNEDNRVKLLRLLAHCAVKADIMSIFTDKEMRLVKYIDANFERNSVEEQKSVCLLLCQMSSHSSGRNFLLYQSPWVNEEGAKKCNSQMTAKVAKISTESLNPALRSFGIGLLHNISLKNESENCGEVLQAHFDLKRDLASFLEEFKLKRAKSISENDGKICEKALENFLRPTTTSNTADFDTNGT